MSDISRCAHGVLLTEKCLKCIFPPFDTSASPTCAGIDVTLAERDKRYGAFDGHALITQRLKEDMRGTDGWRRLAVDQAEALDMIVHKIGRILNGDPNYHDSWHDIVGYAKLVADRLEGRAA